MEQIDQILVHYRLKFQSDTTQIQKDSQINIFSIDYQNLKKKILRILKIPVKNLENCKFELKSSQEIHQINCLEDLQFFTIHNLNIQNKMLQIDIYCHNLLNNKDNKKKQNNQNQNNIRFDEEGEMVGEYQEEFLVNKPSDKMYKSQELVKCAFCRVQNDDKQVVKILGPFYGPFNDIKKKKNHFFHLMCAIWTPNIYLDQKSKMKNVLQEIYRSNKLMCNYCGLLGGGLGCSFEGCKNTYHYKCALKENSQCQLKYQQFTLYCDKHKDIETDIDDQLCLICKSDENDDQILLCDQCDQGYHMYCLNPPLDEVPTDEWYCDNCNESNQSNQQMSQEL